jgi:hypothetical protein
MSQVAQPRIPAVSHPVALRAAAALLALAAVAAVVLVIALTGETQNPPAVSVQSSQPTLRVDGGPEESGVAAAVGAQRVSGPSESTVAAAIGTRAPHGVATSAPDESRVAAAIGAR